MKRARKRRWKRALAILVGLFLGYWAAGHAIDIVAGTLLAWRHRSDRLSQTSSRYTAERFVASLDCFNWAIGSNSYPAGAAFSLGPRLELRSKPAS